MCGHDLCHARRRLLLSGALAGAAIGLLSACGQRTHTGPAPTPVEFGDDTLCILDGLRLIDHPGPKAQIHWVGRDEPDFYCDTVEMFHLFLATQHRDTRIRALYVQDMSQADWYAPRGEWMDARAALYVQGSSRMTAMGTTLASFSEASAADSFVREFGGQILRFADVDADMVVLDGDALHDSSM